MQTKYQRNYKNIYFDLDRTLWDFQSNSDQTLKELLQRYLPEFTNRTSEFLAVYHRVNDMLWIKYRDGEITKEMLRNRRFEEALNEMGLSDTSFSKSMSDDYIAESPLKNGLFPYALEILDYLRNRGYRLYLITNGFSEMQEVKLKSSGLKPYFERMITSEEAGYQKPHRKIFEYALKSVNSRKEESIMIGDDLENDIIGAQRFGMDTIFFNPQKIEHQQITNYEIESLNDIRSIL
jgi:putative hydrolase of the HAD superfamily